jgi:hypothetical protein
VEDADTPGKFVYHATHAWKYVKDVSEFINENIDRGRAFNEWKLLTNNTGYYKFLKTFIVEKEDESFPSLVPDRHIYSFRNGVFHTEHNKFYPYGHPALTPNIVACKFFDMDFDIQVYQSYARWQDVPTPAFESIFQYQEIPEEVIHWIYIFVGRMLYNVGEHDDWQIALFVKGQAGTGKSTLLNVVKKFFYDADVGILSNNIEKKFGLETLYEKLAIFCFEVKANFQMEQSDLQSAISGEDMNIPRKNRVPISIKWNAPCMFAGNEMGPWIDASGSMARRFAMVEFTKRVKVADNDLKNKIDAELATLLYKCNYAYQSAVHNYENKGIWSPGVIPDYFRKTQDNMRRTTNSIIAFIEDGGLVFAPDHYMPFNTFATLYKNHCRTLGLREIPLSDESLEGPFEYKNIKKMVGTMEWDDRMQTMQWVIGATMPQSKDTPEIQQIGS